MNIGIAQIKPFKGDISANIKKHIKFIELASSLNATSIFFPELSLTGYEPELAKDLATHQDDNRFDYFEKTSTLKNITIGVGIPLKTENGIRISMLIFRPNQERLSYSKQQLHEDEFPYFENGNEQVIIQIENQKIIPAICYESLQTEHAEKANKLGGDIYLASVAKSQNGIHKAFKHYPEIAKKYTIPVLMSNCIGECDNFVSVGFSSIWTKEGKLAEQLDNKNEGILVFNTETEKVVKQII
ncbi:MULTISPECIES: carbon-nitrogen hydrolase family protein [unclassified Flavobacterium]|uniref:carbon-nitrogen hydrolase family protein n=1 Tax=unclassified Flavobacterium TaxID=196869 RepID=UPI0012A8DA94|nr:MULTISPECIES: carbon-nitrogen hydrolase family protein [unclassified Flavobacterium]MBF4487264.1 carbon-nitrogen hydrolase family protein [Flavobacterium sp. CSZ]QGK72658.1 carbon-nitrogen hydrolase family protein [Flavobacterium sp. SLB02]